MPAIDDASVAESLLTTQAADVSPRAPPLPAAEGPRSDDAARAARRAQATRDEDDRNAQQARRIAELRWIGPLRAAGSAPVPAGSVLQATTREPQVAGAQAVCADPAPTSAPASAPAFERVESGPPSNPPTPIAIATRALNLRVVTIATAFALLSGGAWLATRDRRQPPVEATPVAGTAPPKSASVVAPAVPDTMPYSRPESALIAAPPAATEPAASAASARFPADIGPTLVLARAQERADLSVAVATYEEIANGIDRKAVTGAARRLWELHRDGSKGMVSNPEQAQHWYDKARKLGARLPVWPADPTGPAAPADSLVASQTLTATPSGAAPMATVRATPAELYERGKKLEARSPRLAEAAFRDAAQQGHGPSQKRMWQLLSGSGRGADAGRYQQDAWDQKVPGIPKPKEALPP